jgi:hypothetical protein
MLVGNPIIESHKQIIKHNIVADLLLAYRKAKDEFGDNFDHVMKVAYKQIRDCQKDAASKPISFFTAGYLLANASCVEFSKEENKHVVMVLYACIAWVYLAWYNRKYNLTGDDD